MKIIGRSKAIYGTWFFLPTYKIMFDCGDGAGSSLGIHSADAEHIFISHTHLDHIAGIPTIMRFQQRVLKNEPNRKLANIYYHGDQIDRIQPLKDFLNSFKLKTNFIEIELYQDIQIGRHVYIRPFPVNHTAQYYRGKFRAMGYHLIEKRKRLNAEYIDLQTKLSADEFRDLMIKTKQEKGEDAINEEYEVKLVTYCGDSEPVPVEEVKGTEILMHEASFMTKEEMEAAHSCVDDVLDLARAAECKALIMYHISERYKRERPKYKQEIYAMAKDKGLTIPIFPVGVDEFFNKEINFN